MECNAFRRTLGLLVVGILTVPTFLIAQSSLSHVRVVRLSYVSGTVAVKRPASTEWAKVQVNTPIQEGFELSTAANSYAEVEFENGSTARLGQFSKANFDQLAIDESGNKLNRLTFEKGYATFHFLPEHHDSYSVKIAESTLTPNGKTEFRADLDHARVRLEVFSGSVELVTPAKTVKLGKDKILEFDPQGTEVAMNQTQGISKDSWDKWTSDRDTQTQLSLVDQAVPSRGLYGWSDLDAYGEWGFFPGFGYGWSPYASAGWSPFGMGMWSFYPGMGYTWISGEPWGWLPYHYGSWGFASGFGWFWMPGNNFSNFSPGLVNWYSGPGYIGWSPLGATGAGMRNSVTTVPGRVIQNGEMVGPQNANRVSTSSAVLISRLPFEPGAGAMLPGTPLTAESREAFTAPAGTVHALAPNSILMGGDGARELSMPATGHASHQPLRARLGPTLGGSYAVRGTVGEFRGDAFAGSNAPRGGRGESPEFSRGPVAGGATLLPHGQQASLAAHSGGGGMMPSGGGGYSNTSAPAPSVSTMSSGHSAGPSPSGGGGGHH